MRVSLIDKTAFTPHVILGPFYPIPQPDGAGADLLVREPVSRHEACELIEVAGRVVTVAGRPVSGALVEIWQANAAGRYAHASAGGDLPVDLGFRGYGAQRTDASGRYRFRTVKPGPYSDGEEMRAPHIHFQVTGRIDRLVTQLFFEGEPLNESDRWLKASRRPHMLQAPLLPARDRDQAVAFTVTWDIVLPNG
jgi:protocatechuate 3,4-dioxygenase, beta subunit